MLHSIEYLLMLGSYLKQNMKTHQTNVLGQYSGFHSAAARTRHTGYLA